MTPPCRPGGVGGHEAAVDLPPRLRPVVLFQHDEPAAPFPRELPHFVDAGHGVAGMERGGELVGDLAAPFPQMLLHDRSGHVARLCAVASS